jgi:hypothetical protein
MTKTVHDEELELKQFFAGMTQQELEQHQIKQHKTLADVIRSKLKAAGIKHDTGKAPMSLLSHEALHQTAMVLEFGRQKYAAHNWRNGFEWSRPLSAAMRHLTAFIDGEDKDPESGLSHLAHAMCCVMFVLEFEKTHPELDDRWKPTNK